MVEQDGSFARGIATSSSFRSSPSPLILVFPLSKLVRTSHLRFGTYSGTTSSSQRKSNPTKLELRRSGSFLLSSLSSPPSHPPKPSLTPALFLSTLFLCLARCCRWYDPKYIINDLNVNSAIAQPDHDETLDLSTCGETYAIKGYAYAGGGRRVTRIEVSLDEGKTWKLSEIT